MRLLVRKLESFSIKAALSIFLLILSLKSESQSFLNLASFNQHKLAVGIEDNRFLIVELSFKKKVNSVLRHTVYTDKIAAQFIQLDIGYNFQASNAFKISPRIYGLSNYSFDRNLLIFNTDIEYTIKKLKLGLSFLLTSNQKELEHNIHGQFGLFYQANKEVAFTSSFGPSINFMSFKNEISIGTIFTSGRIFGRILYRIPEDFNLRYSGINTSICYSIF